ncbi:hypothetical protein E3J62_00190 [candidate division TA06 bacterium]|uniref:FlgD/Vpr Ig-like domain-containing protein n=1 Tax=candidate division TA06 bacterium TaxID=2250710 RepID=A0A523UZD1_UNCT6|nr:MAG: hypothetical protein E3J62_00190 [candidate division TA06 bacterium]
MKNLTQFFRLAIILAGVALVANPLFCRADIPEVDWTQTDWSGGEGQEQWEDPTKYLSDNQMNGWRGPGDLLLDAPNYDYWYETLVLGGGVKSFKSLLALSDGTVLACNTPGYVFRSTDQGETWSGAAVGFGVTRVNCMLEDRQGTIYIGTYPNGLVLKSTDDGAHWVPTGEIPGTPACIWDLIEVDELSEFALWAAKDWNAGGGPVARSYDGGDNWEDLPSFPSADDGCRRLVQTEEAGQLVIYASAYFYSSPELGMDVFKTTGPNLGDDWESIGRIETGPQYETKIPALLWADNGINGWLYAGTGAYWGRVYRYESPDWVQTGVLLEKGRVTDLIQADNGDLYATLGGNWTTDADVARSGDMGDNWHSVAYHPQTSSVYDIMQAPDGTLYDGTSWNKVMKAGYFTEGELVSSVYDTRSILTQYRTIVYSVNENDGVITVKARTDDNSDMSTAPDWSQCSRYDSGDPLPKAPDVEDGERYIQYQITMVPDDDVAPNWSPELQEITLTYALPCLQSSSPEATAYPQGRKIVSVPGADLGDIWVCYQDDWEIYVAHSLDGGSGWVEKTCVGEIYSQTLALCAQLYPCIAVPPPPFSAVAPDVYWVDTCGRLWVVTREGNGWSEPILLVDGYQYDVRFGQPAVAISPIDGLVHIVFGCEWVDALEEVARTDIRHGIWDRASYQTWDPYELGMVDIVMYSKECRTPSIEFDENNGLLHLVYERMGDILSRYWPSPTPLPWLWSEPKLVSDGVMRAEYPFVNADESYVYAAWEASDMTQVHPEVYWKYKEITAEVWPSGLGDNISDTYDRNSVYASILHGIYATWSESYVDNNYEIAFKESPWIDPWTNISDTDKDSKYSHMEIQYDGPSGTSFFLWTDGEARPYDVMVRPKVLSLVGQGLSVTGPAGRESRLAYSGKSTEHAPQIVSHPNPAAGKIRVEYLVSSDTPHKLEVFDISGRMVAALDLGSPRPGWNSVSWGGLDPKGERLPPGTYFLHIRGQSPGPTGKVVLVR